MEGSLRPLEFAEQIQEVFLESEEDMGVMPVGEDESEVEEEDEGMECGDCGGEEMEKIRAPKEERRVKGLTDPRRPNADEVDKTQPSSHALSELVPDLCPGEGAGCRSQEGGGTRNGCVGILS